MKEPQEVTVNKEEEAEPFFTAPLKLPRLKRSVMRSSDGHSPHIVFDQRSGRWVLRMDRP